MEQQYFTSSNVYTENQILETIKSYIDKRQKDYLPLLKVWSNDDPHPQEEVFIQIIQPGLN